jgi:tetratricopeptide (TPR) repeat protein
MKALSVSLGVASAFLCAAPAQSSTLSLGNSLAQTCFQLARSKVSTPLALETCDRALSEESLNFDDRVATFVNRGIVQTLRHSYAQAAHDFDTAIATDAKQPEAWLNKAILLIRQGQGSAAKPMLERAIALKTSKPALAYYMRAMVNEDSGNMRQAYEDLIRARDLDPNWPQPVKELERYRVSRPATGKST